MPLTALDALTKSYLAEGEPIPPEDAVPIHCDEQAPNVTDAFYRQQRPTLLRFLRRRSNPEEADDLLQQSFAEAIAHSRRNVGPIVNPENYLFRIALNLTGKSARRARHQMTAPVELPEDLEPAAPDQVAALEARDMLNRLEGALRALAPRTREIFLAHRIDGYSYKEIAARTGLSVKCVEKHMSKAISHVHRHAKNL